MIEVQKVEETLRAQVDERVDLRRTSARTCIYYPEVGCFAPSARYKICYGCARCGELAPRSVIRSIFDHIKALAISWLGPNSPQSSR
ncbi:MAG: hypothetical protein JW782_04150 [Candidatus Saganbacteria bacterium]|nr:hypothetical protein [Candidatus Saganbacteria bacterium]